MVHPKRRVPDTKKNYKFYKRKKYIYVRSGIRNMLIGIKTK